jgi:hypothetical protein
VNTLLIEPMLNRVSSVFGSFAARSAWPTACVATTLPARAASTTPEKCPASWSLFAYAVIDAAISASVNPSRSSGFGQSFVASGACGPPVAMRRCRIIIESRAIRKDVR